MSAPASHNLRSDATGDCNLSTVKATAPPLEFGRISVPTDNPGKCSRCKHAYHSNGKRMDIHWSIRAQAWLCISCTFQMAEAGA